MKLDLPNLPQLNIKTRIALCVGGGLLLIALLSYLVGPEGIAILHPKGLIAAKERDLMYIAIGLMLLVVIPVFVLTFGIAWKYREGNKATYSPDWDHDNRLEFIWWAFPCLIILILAGVTWKATHELDPFKPLVSEQQPLTIQVVALDWKWLFIYPEEHIATVNYVEFPAGRPINFQITADAPMNSFWIPQLGGQIYAMPGMSTQLHLIADKPDTYKGLSANISGEGFADMRFQARSTSEDEYNNWVQTVKQLPNGLDQAEYAQIAKPSQKNGPTYYASVPTGLYDTVIGKYMTHSHDSIY